MSQQPLKYRPSRLLTAAQPDIKGRTALQNAHRLKISIVCDNGISLCTGEFLDLLITRITHAQQRDLVCSWLAVLQ